MCGIPSLAGRMLAAGRVHFAHRRAEQVALP